MRNIISLKELKQNINKYIIGVSKGKEFIVFKKSKPIFRLVPYIKKEVWEEVVDFTKFCKRGIPIKEFLV